MVSYRVVDSTETMLIISKVQNCQVGVNIVTKIEEVPESEELTRWKCQVWFERTPGQQAENLKQALAIQSYLEIISYMIQFRATWDGVLLWTSPISFSFAKRGSISSIGKFPNLLFEGGGFPTEYLPDKREAD